MSRDCPIPPPGWWCSRGAGHEGPCAARLAQYSEPYIDGETDLCLEMLIRRMEFLDSQERRAVFSKLEEFYCHDCGRKYRNNMCHCQDDE